MVVYDFVAIGNIFDAPIIPPLFARVRQLEIQNKSNDVREFVVDTVSAISQKLVARSSSTNRNHGNPALITGASRWVKEFFWQEIRGVKAS